MTGERIAKGLAMNFDTFTRSIIALSLAALPLGLSAQTAGPAPAPTGEAGAENEIVVEAPRTLPAPRKKKKSVHSGAPSVVATVRMMVLYGDLDLTKPADAERLTARINRTARDACGYLDQLYPLVRDAECVKRAVEGAETAAKAVIATKQAAPTAASPSPN